MTGDEGVAGLTGEVEVVPRISGCRWGVRTKELGLWLIGLSHLGKLRCLYNLSLGVLIGWE